MDVNEGRLIGSLQGPFFGCSAAYYDPLAATAHFRHRASAEPCYVEVIRGQSSGKEAPSTPRLAAYLVPWTDELGPIHCLQERRLIHTGTAVLGNQTHFYKPPPLTEADMKFLRELAALDKAHPLVRAHHEDLFSSLFVERNRASLNNLPQRVRRWHLRTSTNAALRKQTHNSVPQQGRSLPTSWTWPTNLA